MCRVYKRTAAHTHTRDRMDPTGISIVVAMGFLYYIKNNKQNPSLFNFQIVCKYFE